MTYVEEKGASCDSHAPMAAKRTPDKKADLRRRQEADQMAALIRVALNDYIEEVVEARAREMVERIILRDVPPIMRAVLADHVRAYAHVPNVPSYSRFKGGL